ncbi:putative methyltransferase C1B3.06c like protein [Verticillium longisporum]|nr:putative methyltransferase C1B3.06c like protein [Verticillium longisporum]
MSTNYTQGYSKATTSSHAARTIHSDAAFVLPFIDPADRILDVGCGPGTITTGFATIVPQGEVVGIDLSDEVLATARSSVPAGLSNISFQRANLLEGLPFLDGHFSVVFSSQVFPHLATAEMRTAALKEMRRVTRPGGLVATREVAEMHFYPRAGGLNELLTGNMNKVLRAGQEDGWFPGGEMPALFRQLGFTPDEIKVGAGTTVHSGEEGRRAFGAGYGARLSRGDPYYESWKRAGISDEEIDRTVEALNLWTEDPDAWCVVLQAELWGRWKVVVHVLTVTISVSEVVA